MTDPSKHYHRIETDSIVAELPAAETGVNTRPDVEYLITRVRGQLERIHALSKPGDPFWPLEIRAAVAASKNFLDILQATLKDKQHYDVV